MVAERVSAEIFPPGEYLRDELEERGWKQTEFAEIIGRPTRVINEIIAGKRAITPETAREFAAALGTSPQFWLNLETAYQLWKTPKADVETITRNAKLRERFPVREMINRRWLEPSENIEVLEAQILKFYEIRNPDAPLSFLHAAKKNMNTYGDEIISPIQLAWLFKVKNIASSVSVPEYSEKALREALLKLLDLLSEPEGVKQVPRILMECGIRFIVVESLPSAKIDGVCFWLDENSPVIGMSLARDQIDNFWFVLRHEIEHILNGDGKEEGGMIDQDLSGESAGTGKELPEEERRANQAAAEFLVPQDELESFISRKSPYYYEKDVVAFAALHHIHPGIVVGQIQFRSGKWDWLRKHLAKIRQYLLPEAIVDGWGRLFPV